MKRSILFGTALVWFSSVDADGLDGLFRIGIGFGGDEAVTIVFNDGKTESFDFGDGIMMDIGVNYSYQNFSIKLTGGYQGESISDDFDNRVSFNRIPINALVGARLNSHHFNVGITYHLSPTSSCEIDGYCNSEFEFENALGYIGEYEYKAFREDTRFDFDLGLGLRYTQIEYEDALGFSYNGNSIALSIAWYFL